MSGPRFVLLVFAGGLWDGEELTSIDPPPEWIPIGATGRYTRINCDAAAPTGEGPSTAYYVWGALRRRGQPARRLTSPPIPRRSRPSRSGAGLSRLGHTTAMRLSCF